MNFQQATSVVDHFNAAMRIEGVNVSAEWIGGHYPLEVHCGWRTMTPASPYRNTKDVQDALKKTLVILQRWGVVHTVPR